MSRRKVSTGVYMTPEQEAAIRALAAKTRVPMAVYIRDGIDLVLQKYAANDAQKSAAGGG
jgi:predicted DNA-binding protein